VDLSSTFTQADRNWMRFALQLAGRAAAEGEVPVGAVVVRGDTDIGEGWNSNIGQKDPAAHAEIVALRDAGRTIGNHRLVDCTLYVTLEPCCMCAGALIHARVARVVYGATDPKTGAAGSVFDVLVNEAHNHSPVVQGGLLADLCSEPLQRFFRDKRRKAAADPK